MIARIAVICTAVFTLVKSIFGKPHVNSKYIRDPRTLPCQTPTFLYFDRRSESRDLKGMIGIRDSISGRKVFILQSNE